MVIIILKIKLIDDIYNFRNKFIFVMWWLAKPFLKVWQKKKE